MAKLTSAVGYSLQMIGKAGEYAVAAQLMLRGVNVYFPACDYGADLMADTGCRIQVKSARISASPGMVRIHGSGVYVFPLHKSRRMPMSNARVRLVTRPKMSAVADVVVFWGIEQNRFWIVPSTLCEQRQCFVLGKESPSRYVGSERELRELVTLGYSHDEIAAQYGISRSRITVMLNHPETIATEPSVVSLVRQCENAWEHILNFGSSEPANENAPQGARVEEA